MIDFKNNKGLPRPIVAKRVKFILEWDVFVEEKLKGEQNWVSDFVPLRVRVQLQRTITKKARHETCQTN